MLKLHVMGSVPKFFLKRIRLIQESSINDWLRRLLDPTKYLEDFPRPNVQPAKISGNILVLFAVWSGGLSISLLIILIETIWGNRRVIVSKIQTLALSISNFASEVTRTFNGWIKTCFRKRTQTHYRSTDHRMKNAHEKVTPQ